MAYTRNPPWKDAPDTSTLITAAKLENIENGLLDAANAADTALSRTAPDATTTSKGIVQLAGDLDGTAAAPMVPGLAAKLDVSAAPELIRDTMGTALVAGANVTITPNDAGDSITIAAGTSAPAAINGGPAIVDDSYAPLAPVGATAVYAGDTSANRISLGPIAIGATLTCASFAINVATAAASSNVRVAIYADSNGHPGALVWDSGLIASATTGTKTVTPGSAVTLNRGSYWTALSLSDASVNISGWRHSGLGLPSKTGFSFPTSVNNYVVTGQPDPIANGFPASLATATLNNKDSAVPLIAANITGVAA